MRWPYLQILSKVNENVEIYEGGEREREKSTAIKSGVKHNKLLSGRQRKRMQWKREKIYDDIITFLKCFLCILAYQCFMELYEFNFLLIVIIRIYTDPIQHRAALIYAKHENVIKNCVCVCVFLVYLYGCFNEYGRRKWRQWNEQIDGKLLVHRWKSALISSNYVAWYSTMRCHDEEEP